MHDMMMDSMGPMILGFHLETFLMLISGVFYFFCTLLLWRTYRKDKNELVGALLAFLFYQTINMFFMGLEMHTMNMLYSNIAAFSVLVGSTYMLKFPFSSYSETTRKNIFLFSLAVALGIFAWFIQTPEKQMELMHFTLWYDIVVNGIMVGGFMLMLALRTNEKILKLKALGGGTGVVSCCVVANGAMLTGAMVTSSVFGFLAPVFILGSLLFSKTKQPKVTEKIAS